MVGKRVEKAKVEVIPMATEAEIADHLERERLRASGLYMPPSEAELNEAKLRGVVHHDPRLVIPGEEKQGARR